MFLPLGLIGIVIFAAGGISGLFAAFRTGFAWGVSCLVVPPIAILHVVCHWSDAKGPFQVQLLGLGIIALSVYG